MPRQTLGLGGGVTRWIPVEEDVAKRTNDSLNLDSVFFCDNIQIYNPTIDGFLIP